MRISIIYGTEPNSFIYSQVHLLLKQLNTNLNTVVNEFFISRDLPKRTSYDWYSFFFDEMSNSEYKKVLNKISYSLYKSDLIILASSTCSKQTLKQMNNLLNHLSYKWMPHKRNIAMSNKIALALSDSSYFTFDFRNRMLSKSLRFWGINKDCIFKKTFISKSYNNPSINNIYISNFALKIIYQYKKSHKIITPNFALNSQKHITTNPPHNESPKNCSTKKALLLSKCFTNIKKVVHA